MNADVILTILLTAVFVLVMAVRVSLARRVFSKRECLKQEVRQECMARSNGKHVSGMELQLAFERRGVPQAEAMELTMEVLGPHGPAFNPDIVCALLKNGSVRAEGGSGGG